MAAEEQEKLITVCIAPPRLAQQNKNKLTFGTARVIASTEAVKKRDANEDKRRDRAERFPQVGQFINP